MSLKGKTALVTGASRGIGRAIAIFLAEQGATVLGVASSESGADKMTHALKELGYQGQGYALDICETDQIKAVLTKMHETFDSPDILVNNAGITKDNIILRMKPEQWEKVISTNLSAAFYLSKACLKPMLKKRWGRIVNISSVVALMGNLGQANYVSAKAGLMGLTKTLAIEFAAYGITANCIAPGFIRTEMTDAVSIEHQDKLLSRIPMKRIGDVADITGAVGFLVSEHASYITGETLHVNGGMYMV